MLQKLLYGNSDQRCQPALYFDIGRWLEDIEKKIITKKAF